MGAAAAGQALLLQSAAREHSGTARGALATHLTPTPAHIEGKHGSDKNHKEPEDGRETAAKDWAMHELSHDEHDT